MLQLYDIAFILYYLPDGICFLSWLILVLFIFLVLGQTIKTRQWIGELCIPF